MQYATILIDPPWRFKNATAASLAQRSVTRHYQTMPLDDIKALPVRSYAAKDCALFLWVIDTHIEKAMEVIKAWGFVYATVAFYWVKTNPRSGTFFTGLGWWTRSGPELCLLATRGQPKRLSRSVKRLIVAPRREHSRKPDEVYSSIERLVAGPYLDCFSRERRVGWDQAFSDQPDHFTSVAGDGAISYNRTSLGEQI